MGKNKSLRAGIWYTGSSFLLKSISFITTPYFTRTLTKNEMGIFSVASTWISILSVILSFNLYDTVILARYDYKNDKEYKEYISTISIFGTIVGIVFYIFVLFLKKYVVLFTGMPLYAIHIILIYVIFCPCTSIIMAKYRAEIQCEKTVLISLITALLSTFFSVFFVLTWDDKLQGRFVGTYIPGIIINIILFFVLVLNGKSFKMSYCRYALPLGLPLIIHYLSGTVMGFSDRIMIQKICGNEDVAIYSIAYTCAMFAEILRNSLNSAWDPWVFEKLNCKKTDDIKIYSRYYLSFFILSCLFMMLLAPEILFIFGGENYSEAKFVIPPVVVGYIFCMMYSLFSCLERYAKQQKKMAIITFFCAIVNIYLNYILIPFGGYIMAAYTTMICYMLSFILHYHNVKRIGLDHIYDIKMILKIMGISIAFAGIILFSYSLYILRIILIIILVIICFFYIVKNREKLLMVVHTIIKK